MTPNEFIFSNKTSHRVTRHLVFWGLYFFYFWLQSFSLRKFNEFFISDTYYFAFLNVCCFGPVFVFAAYFFIYYLVPQTLQKKRYAFFIFSFLLVYLVGTFINYFTAGIFLNAAGTFLHNLDPRIPIEPNFQHRIQFSNYNTRFGMIIAIIASGIKLSKDWYLQQQENLAILTKKTRAEMLGQKARIHPELLFRSLHSINYSIQTGSVKSNSIILNLSDLLSYSLYESETAFVPLEKELVQLRHLITLEQLSPESLINIQVKIEGETSDKLIAPMVLVKPLEESLNLIHRAEAESWLMILRIAVRDNNLSFNLSLAKPDVESCSNTNWDFFIENPQSRLRELYSAKDYQVELVKNQKEMIIKLDINLTDNTKETNQFQLH